MIRPPRNLDDLPLMLTADEAAQVLRVSRWSVYQQVQAGTLHAVKLGRSLRIPRAAIAQLLAGNGEGPAEAGPSVVSRLDASQHGDRDRA